MPQRFSRERRESGQSRVPQTEATSVVVFTEIFQRKRERVDRAEHHRQRPRQFLSRELAECLLSNALLRKDVLYIPPGTWFRQFLCGGC